MSRCHVIMIRLCLVRDRLLRRRRGGGSLQVVVQDEVLQGEVQRGQLQLGRGHQEEGSGGGEEERGRNVNHLLTTARYC